MRSRRQRSRVSWVLLGSAAGLVMLAATAVLGPLVGVVVVAAVGLVLLLGHPRAAVALLVLVGLAFDANTGAQLGQDRAWTPVAGTALPIELLLAVAVAAVAVDVIRTRRPLLGLGAFTGPALLYVLAVVLSAVTGVFGGSSPLSAIEPARTMALTFVVALVVVQVLRSRADVERALLALCGLAVVKLGSGLALLAAGYGTGAPTSRSTAGGGVSGGGLSFYEGATAMLAIGIVVGAPAYALLARRVPARAVVAWVLAAAALVLSLRRGWWLGTAAAVPFAAALLAGRPGRRLLAPAVVVAASLVVLLATGVVRVGTGEDLGRSGPGGVVAERLESLRPSALGGNAFDRYRVGETRNVLAALERSPVVGLGAGRPWPQRYGLSLYLGEDLDTYAHSSYLYQWMVMGIAGLVAYAWLLVLVVLRGRDLARDRAAPPGLRALGVVALALGVANAVASATQAQLGADARLGLGVGVLLGLLVAATRTTREVVTGRAHGDPAPVRLAAGDPAA